MIPGQHEQGQKRAEKLGNDGGIGHAFYAHAQHHHKDQIQRGIDNGGENQKVQRAAGIAHGPKNAGTHIVKQQSQQTGKINGQIGMRLREDVLRGGLEPQQRVRPQNAQGGKGHGQNKGDADGGMHGFVQSFVIAAAVALGNDHAGAGGKAGGEAHQHVDDAGCGAYGGQRLLTYKLPHHNGIHRVV